jgi:hypothetical protein
VEAPEIEKEVGIGVVKDMRVHYGSLGEEALEQGSRKLAPQAPPVPDKPNLIGGMQRLLRSIYQRG